MFQMVLKKVKNNFKKNQETDGNGRDKRGGTVKLKKKEIFITETGKNTETKEKQELKQRNLCKMPLHAV